MDSQLAELIRKYEGMPDLDNGLRTANELLRAGSKEDAFRFLDTVYMHHLHTLPGVVAEVSPEYHADITTRVGYINESATRAFQIVRREAQALEAIAERGTRPRITEITKEQHVRQLLMEYDLREVPEELIQLPYLQMLYLNNNPLKTLQGLPKLPQLRYIRLRGNNIPEEELEELRNRGIKFHT